MSVLPIVDRELRVAARRKSTYLGRTWAALGMLLIWFVVLISTNSRSSRQLGHELFSSLGTLALTLSMFAGIFLTSDSLSEEKREGTLGLLFLTNLKGYDVVLGKMAAHSLHAFFGLLAMLPVIGLTILMGGVTGKEFFRVVLVFVVTSFFSLSLGMAVSSMCRDARQAIATTFLVMLILAGLMPAFWWLQRMTINNPGLDFLLWPSPVTTYIASLDNRYKFGTGSLFFWESLGTLYCLGLCSIILANLVLPHSWHDKVHVKKEKSSLHPTKDASVKGGVGLLELFRRYEPALWLALRDSSPRKVARRLYLIFLPVWFAGLLVSVTTRWSHEGFIMAMFVAYAMHVMVKVVIATEASRRMNLDRRNGAWELLLVTPLTVRSIVAGQKKALWRHFRSILLGLVLVNLMMIVVVEIFHKHLDMDFDDQLMFHQLFLGGIVMLFADFQSLGWVGMWRGLNGRQHHRAVLGTLAQIMGLPLILIFLLFVIQPVFRSRGAPIIVMALWFGISMALDVASAIVARRRLLADFRGLVAAAHR